MGGTEVRPPTRGTEVGRLGRPVAEAWATTELMTELAGAGTPRAGRGKGRAPRGRGAGLALVRERAVVRRRRGVEVKCIFGLVGGW